MLALSCLARSVVCAKTLPATFRGYAQSSAARENHKLRVELAAAYRGMEYYNLHEGVDNHITALAPAADNSGRELMLLVPEGLHWSQVNHIIIFLLICQNSKTYIMSLNIMPILTTAYQSWKVPTVKLNIILCKTLYSAGFQSKFWWISQSQNQSQRFYYKKIITIHRMTQRLKPIWVYLSHKFLPLFSVQWLHFDDNSVSTGASTEAVRPTKATSYKQISLDLLRGLNYLIRPNKLTHKGWHILLYLFNDIYIVFVYFHQVTPSCLLGLDEHNEIV